MDLPPPVADEREGLTSFLDQQRDAIKRKVSGISAEQARRTPTASALSLAVIVRHLARVERRWFQAGVAGLDVPDVWPRGDWEQEYTVPAGQTLDSVLAYYDEQVSLSREVTAAADLSEACKLPELADRGMTVRWVLLHMIEETARHAGHADIIRETIDGSTGL